MKYFLGVLFISIFSLFTVKKDRRTIEWNEGDLSFTDFKGESTYTGEKVKGEFAGLIKWSYSVTNDDVPKYTIRNKMDTRKSWISAESEELLSEYQFMWNLQELYARKMRKAAEELNMNNEHDTKVYRDTFHQYIKQLQDDKRRYTGMIYNQPDFKKILNKQYMDSLQIYDQYKLD